MCVGVLMSFFFAVNNSKTINPIIVKQSGFVYFIISDDK